MISSRHGVSPPSVPSRRASASLGVAAHFIHEAAERERMMRILRRFVPTQYQWMLLELIKREEG